MQKYYFFVINFMWRHKKAPVTNRGPKLKKSKKAENLAKEFMVLWRALLFPEDEGYGCRQQY